MKIYLIRHGETTGDVEDRYGGSYDDHMTELGKSQLKETADKLVGRNIEVIFSSPLIRAKESSEIISSVINCPVEYRDGLRERNYGLLGGLTKQEALTKYPEAVEIYKNPMETPIEGESYSDFQERVLTTFKNLIKENYQTIAILSHGGPIKQILGFLNMNIPPKLGDGEIIETEYSS
jgi:broad specificity phosphatase PhoE